MNLLWFENLLLMRLWVWNAYLVLLWNKALAYPRALLPSGGPLSCEFWQLTTPLTIQKFQKWALTKRTFYGLSTSEIIGRDHHARSPARSLWMRSGGGEKWEGQSGADGPRWPGEMTRRDRRARAEISAHCPRSPGPRSSMAEITTPLRGRRRTWFLRENINDLLELL